MRQELLDLLRERTYPSSFEEIRTRYRLTSTVDDLWRSYCADIAAMMSCPADVLTGLDEMRRHGRRVGIAANGATDIQTAKLRATGIHSRVEGICVSGEVAARKPEQEHFAQAAARCGTTLSAGGWMIGDNPVNDIGGGQAAGLGTIWIANGSPWLVLPGRRTSPSLITGFSTPVRPLNCSCPTALRGVRCDYHSWAAAPRQHGSRVRRPVACPGCHCAVVPAQSE